MSLTPFSPILYICPLPCRIRLCRYFPCPLHYLISLRIASPFLSSQMSPHFLRFSVQLPQFPSHSLGSLRPSGIHLVPSVLIMFSQNSSMAPRRPSDVFYRSLTHAPSRQLTRRPPPLLLSRVNWSYVGTPSGRISAADDPSRTCQGFSSTPPAYSLHYILKYTTDLSLASDVNAWVNWAHSI